MTWPRPSPIALQFYLWDLVAVVSHTGGRHQPSKPYYGKMRPRLHSLWDSRLGLPGYEDLNTEAAVPGVPPSW